MNEIASQLHKLRLRFVERAVVQLTRGEGLRQLAAEQITRFYSLLEDAVESGNPEWLDSCLQDWVNARSRSAFGERLTLLPVLDKLKATAWDVVRENCPPQQSLDVIVAMELSFVHAQSFVAVLEVDALLQETAARLHEAQANLRRLEKSKSSFIAVAAHELKTPLTLIEGYADMLTDELKTGGALRVGETYGREGDYVTGTVGNVEASLACRFARSWRSLDPRVLELESDCDDGTRRTVVLAFPEGDEGAGLYPTVESVAGETGWEHVDFAWAWRKCATDTACPPF